MAGIGAKEVLMRVENLYVEGTILCAILNYIQLWVLITTYRLGLLLELQHPCYRE